MVPYAGIELRLNFEYQLTKMCHTSALEFSVPCDWSITEVKTAQPALFLWLSSPVQQPALEPLDRIQTGITEYEGGGVFPLHKSSHLFILFL